MDSRLKKFPVVRPDGTTEYLTKEEYDQALSSGAAKPAGTENLLGEAGVKAVEVKNRAIAGERPEEAAFQSFINNATIVGAPVTKAFTNNDYDQYLAEENKVADIGGAVAGAVISPISKLAAPAKLGKVAKFAANVGIDSLYGLAPAISEAVNKDQPLDSELLGKHMLGAMAGGAAGRGLMAAGSAAANVISKTAGGEAIKKLFTRAAEALPGKRTIPDMAPEARDLAKRLGLFGPGSSPATDRALVEEYLTNPDLIQGQRAALHELELALKGANVEAAMKNAFNASGPGTAAARPAAMAAEGAAAEKQVAEPYVTKKIWDRLKPEDQAALKDHLLYERAGRYSPDVINSSELVQLSDLANTSWLSKEGQRIVKSEVDAAAKEWEAKLGAEWKLKNFHEDMTLGEKLHAALDGPAKYVSEGPLKVSDVAKGAWEGLKGGGLAGMPFGVGKVAGPAGALVGAGEVVGKKLFGPGLKGMFENWAQTGMLRDLESTFAGKILEKVKDPAVLEKLGALAGPLLYAASEGGAELLGAHAHLAEAAGNRYMEAMGMQHDPPDALDAALGRATALNAVREHTQDMKGQIDDGIDGFLGLKRGRPLNPFKADFASASKLPEKLMSDAANAFNQVPEGIRNGAPATAAAATNTMMMAAKYLQDTLPKDPNVNQPPALKRDFVPNPVEQQRWLRRYEAIVAPERVVANMRNGVLVPEQMDALQVVYPEMFNALKRAMYEKISTLKSQLPYSKRLMLSKVMGPEFIGNTPKQASTLQQLHDITRTAPPAEKPRSTVNQEKALGAARSQSQKLEAL